MLNSESQIMSGQPKLLIPFNLNVDPNVVNPCTIPDGSPFTQILTLVPACPLEARLWKREGLIRVETEAHGEAIAGSGAQVLSGQWRQEFDSWRQRFDRIQAVFAAGYFQ